MVAGRRAIAVVLLPLLRAMHLGGRISPCLLVPGAGIEPAWPKPRDFKSLVSTNFTTRAGGWGRGRVGASTRSGQKRELLASTMGIRWDGIQERNMEAEVGIEPASTALQAAA